MSTTRQLTELELLRAVDAGHIWHEYDHNHVVLEDDQGQDFIDDQFEAIDHLAHCDGGSVYKLTGEGRARLAELNDRIGDPDA